MRAHRTHLAIYVPDFTDKVKKFEAKGLVAQDQMEESTQIAFFKDPDRRTDEIMNKGLQITD